jgi:hypothetical protein
MLFDTAQLANPFQLVSITHAVVTQYRLFVAKGMVDVGNKLGSSWQVAKSL